MARPSGPQRSKRHPKRRRGEPEKPALKRVRGTVRMNGDGSAKLLAEVRGTPSVFLPPEEIVGVRDGDVVTVELGVGRKGRVRGRIVERGPSRSGTVVGVLRRQARFTYLLPDDGSSALVVPTEELGDAKDGDAVEARILREGEAEGASVARVEQVLGDPLDPKVQVEMAVRATKWPREFDAAVDAEVAKFPPVDPTRVLVDGRIDLRGVPHVTIDGEDARDFDDAVSAKPEGDRYRVWVSIADVSHYVREGTALDDAARARATSVYFPDRVLPMLPERLSNDLCSLRPNLPRLTMTAEFLVDADGTMTNVQVYHSLIDSAARLTYNIVQEVLDAKDVGISGPKHPQTDLIHKLVIPARWLRAQRTRRGAIDFEIPESRIQMGPDGAAADIVQRPRLEAHRLIEDLMVAANEAVAEYLIGKSWPALFRVHDSPDPMKLELLVRWAGKLGIDFDPDAARDPKVLQKFILRMRSHPAASVVQSLVLRMMQQARYGPENLGHYGLASKAYAHFTSPIRRYPDLVVHRALKALWAGQGKLQNLEGLGTHCSQQERKAMEAERGVTQLMACQIATKHVGEDMTAQVMGVHPAGAFVRPVELFVDGLIPMEALSHHFRGYFEYVEDDQMLFSRRTKTKIGLGDRLEVQLTGVNMKRRQIDFAMTEQGKEPFRSKKQMGWRRDRDQEREVKAKLRRPPEEAPGERKRGRFEQKRPPAPKAAPERQERHSDSLRRVREETRSEQRPRPPQQRPAEQRPPEQRPPVQQRPPGEQAARPRSWEEQFLSPPSEPVRPKRWEEMRERIGQRGGERERPRPERPGMTDVSDPYASRAGQKPGRKSDSAPADGRPPRRNKRATGGRPSGRPGGRGPRGRR
ncbi:MAG TPA: VacB/RNase II family 3'-5' exoribonuclease [Myxococcota bacterium]|nr:VacB/RNase II family 3'-5' exoribonuclease [Myxococcota bacterium]